MDQPRPAAGSLSRAIGRHLRAARRRRRLTLAAVAAEARISESFLSQLERGLTGASLDSLQRLTEALGLRVADLFEPRNVGSPAVLTREARPVLHVWHLGHKMLLTPRSTEHLEVMICHLDPGGATGEASYTHGHSEELALILDGEVDLELDGALHTMAPGDCITYDSSQPHRFINRGGSSAEVLTAIAPPSL